MTAPRKASGKTGCESCKHRAVVVAPGTARQVGLRYKAAWDACYKCAVTRGRRVAKLEDWLYGEAEKCTEFYLYCDAETHDIRASDVLTSRQTWLVVKAEAARIRGRK